MAKHRSSRTLAIILHADVVGSTDLVRRDETLAHERIHDAFVRFSQTVRAYGGTPREIRGDALLAEFARASDAVCAALAFQADNLAHNESIADDVRPEVRVGISLGEVVVADGTLTGPDVVLAQRLEQLAEPGGVRASPAVFQSVPRRLPFEWRDLGEHDVKGFDEPVRVYAVAGRTGEPIPAPDPALRRASRVRWPVAAATLALAAVAVLATWLQPWRGGPGAGTAGGATLPLPDEPSIAVMPFEDMGGDPDQRYFAEGIAEDLITDLSKVSGLFVISRNSSFAYRGEKHDTRKVAGALGVRYVLEGSVRRNGEQVRINVQLIDATTGGPVWAERYDGVLGDVFGLQDKVTGNVVTTLAVRLTAGEEERIGRRGTDDPRAYDVFLRGWEHYHRQTPEDLRSAIALFEEALEIDPGYDRARAALAATYWQVWRRLWGPAVGIERWHDVRFRAEETLARVMDDPVPLALQVRAEMRSQAGRHEEAVADAEHAVALDPNDADGYATLAGVLALAGHYERALGSIERAMRLNPHFPPHYLYQLGLVRFGMGRLDDAETSLRRALALNPDDRWSARLLLAIHGLRGERDEAARLVDEMERRANRDQESLDPLTVRSSAFWHPFARAADRERLADGLRRAGVPD